MHWAIPLAILILFEGVADILAKYWSIHRGLIYAAGSLLGYMLANTSWLFALKNGSGLARGAIIFSVASAILAALIGLLLYKEELGRLQMIGAGLGIIAIVLLSWE